MEAPLTISARISTATILRLFLVVFALLVLWALRDIILLLFLSIILAAAISPWITTLSRYHIPRPIGVLIVYSIIALLIALLVVLLVPAVTKEAASLSARFPGFYDRVIDFFRSNESQKTISSGTENLSALTHRLFSGLKGFAGGVASFVLVLVITFYFTIDEENVLRFGVRLAPGQYRERVRHIISKAHERIGSWFKGQLAASLVVGIVSFGALTVLGIPNALLLSIVAGIAAFVPFVGAAIGTIPAVVVALTVSVPKAVVVLGISLALYQLVANVLIPKIMSRVVGLNPVVIILVMLLGAELAGAIGLILAVPIASVVDLILREMRSSDSIKQAAREYPHGT